MHQKDSQIVRIMFSRAILLLIIVPLSVAIDTPLVGFLPEDRFSASSSYNESVTAPNVRIPSERSGSLVPMEPWCPKKRKDSNYAEEYVAVDLGCQQTVRELEGKDSQTLRYAGEYSNDEKKWKKLTSKTFKTNNDKAVIKPPVQARYFRFRIRVYNISWPLGSVPCLKVEMYGSSTCAEKPVEPGKPIEPEIPVEPENPAEPIGCFTEAKKRLPVVYHTFKGSVSKKCRDISAVYEECKQKAAESLKHLEIFGIRKNRYCVTTETGKFDEYFNKAPDSSNCKTCQGEGIGTKKTVFVYKK